MKQNESIIFHYIGAEPAQIDLPIDSGGYSGGVLKRYFINDGDSYILRVNDSNVIEVTCNDFIIPITNQFMKILLDNSKVSNLKNIKLEDVKENLEIKKYEYFNKQSMELISSNGRKIRVEQGDPFTLTKKSDNLYLLEFEHFTSTANLSSQEHVDLISKSIEVELHEKVLSNEDKAKKHQQAHNKYKQLLDKILDNIPKQQHLSTNYQMMSDLLIPIFNHYIHMNKQARYKKPLTTKEIHLSKLATNFFLNHDLTIPEFNIDNPTPLTNIQPLTLISKLEEFAYEKLTEERGDKYEYNTIGIEHSLPILKVAHQLRNGEFLRVKEFFDDPNVSTYFYPEDVVSYFNNTSTKKLANLELQYQNQELISPPKKTSSKNKLQK